MADQMINQLPVKTAPQTGDRMLMIGAAEEYQIDYDKLADAILNKLTSKTYSLDQGTKSLVAALNDLNSKFRTNVELIRGTEYVRLETNANIDTLFENGTYATITDAAAVSIIGKPDEVTRKFKLVVSDTIGSTYKDGKYKRQRLYPFNSSTIYDRFNEESGWSEWKKIQTV